VQCPQDPDCHFFCLGRLLLYFSASPLGRSGLETYGVVGFHQTGPLRLRNPRGLPCEPCLACSWPASFAFFRRYALGFWCLRRAISFLMFNSFSLSPSLPFIDYSLIAGGIRVLRLRRDPFVEFQPQLVRTPPRCPAWAAQTRHRPLPPR